MSETKSVIAELSVVALRHPRECDGKVMPQGTQGAVVHVYRDGIAYEVDHHLLYLNFIQKNGW